MKAIKKPIKIEYYPCNENYLNDIMKWSTDKRSITYSMSKNAEWEVTYFYISIHTVEWVMRATTIDVIIKWVHWEVYPCKKDIFEKTYDY